eukprot:767965-Hanusia_phi.AAC.1
MTFQLTEFSGGFWRSPIHDSNAFGHVIQEVRRLKRLHLLTVLCHHCGHGTVRYASHSFGSGVVLTSNGAGARSWRDQCVPCGSESGQFRVI